MTPGSAPGTPPRESAPGSPRESPRGSRRASDGESAASPPISPSAERRAPRLTAEALRASQLDDALPEQERPTSLREQARESPPAPERISGSQRPLVRLSASPSPARSHRSNGAREVVPAAALEAGFEEFSAAAVTAAALETSYEPGGGLGAGLDSRGAGYGAGYRTREGSGYGTQDGELLKDDALRSDEAL
ncbi:hypothetical protein T492DRAFT_1124465 [Pavlovales sp. CCMP2436]|nr:hypothetical protein T492DRAFT_1124465 [Pavlovales sp. CCMP2436]